MSGFRLHRGFIVLAAIAALVVGAALYVRAHDRDARFARREASAPVRVVDRSSSAAKRLVAAAESQIGKTVRYDAAYTPIKYPGGDVPIDRGVCTDVVVRAFRAMGVDLQVKIHRDMVKAFDRYPHRWGLQAPDTNIDHRRVPNMQLYFTRTGKSLPITHDGQDYQPGDVVIWSVRGRPHTGIVTRTVAEDGTHFCIVHNFGRGTQIEDILFRYPITGHYRYF